MNVVFCIFLRNLYLSFITRIFSYFYQAIFNWVFTFDFVSNFELIFIFGVKYGSMFIFCPYRYLIAVPLFVERHSIPHRLSQHLCQIQLKRDVCIFFQTPYSSSFFYQFMSFPILYCFQCRKFIVSFEVKYCTSSKFFGLL